MLDTDTRTFMNRLRAAALQDGDDLLISTIIRYALSELRRRGGWPELREPLRRAAIAGPQRGGRPR